MKNHEHLRQLFFVCTLCIIILFFGISIFILPSKSFSEKENRSLVGIPDISLKALSNGNFFDSLSKFYSDQFPLRDTFTSIYAITELSFGKCESNGVIYAKENTLITKSNTDNEKALSALKKISSVCKQAPFIYIPPSSDEIFSDRLPSISAAPPFSYGDLDGSMYYKTDHHWTTEGAYVAYSQICELMDLQTKEQEYFEIENVATDFYGTAYARACLPRWAVRADTISLYRYSGDTEIEVFYSDTGKSKNGFYDMDALSTADKYRVFLGGNFSHIKISGKEKKPTLLLIKDSFANSVVPFLAIHFDIEMVDPRYCTQSFLYDQLAREDVDSILILMSKDTLSQI